MSKSSKPAPSRSAESRRERRIIRNWFKAASVYVFTLDHATSHDEVNAVIADFERADALLATLSGYTGSSFVSEKFDGKAKDATTKLVNAISKRVEVAPNVVLHTRGGK